MRVDDDCAVVASAGVEVGVGDVEEEGDRGSIAGLLETPKESRVSRTGFTRGVEEIMGVFAGVGASFDTAGATGVFCHYSKCECVRKGSRLTQFATGRQLRGWWERKKVI